MNNTVETVEDVHSNSFLFVDMDNVKREPNNEEEDIKSAFTEEILPNVEFLTNDIKKDANAENEWVDTVDIKEEPIDINVCKEEAACPSCRYNMEDGVSNLISNRSALETKDLTKTLPKNFFQIENNVYALRCIPENMLFGPYTGLESLRNNTGYTWILNGGRQAEADNKHLYNWIRYIQFSEDETECNLSVFQGNGFLYYRCRRDIVCGERLIAHLDDSLVKNFSNDTGKYYCPVEFDVPHVYACIPCCLGFNTETYLRQHMQRRCCFIINNNNNIQSILIDIVQCPLCKMVSCNKKDIKYHLRNNCANNKRMLSSNTSTAVNAAKSDAGELHRCVVCDAVFKYRTNLKRHMNAHENGKKYHCYQCDYKADRKGNLKSHIISKHTGEHACHKCDFVAKRRADLKLHKLSVHSDVNNKTAAETNIDRNGNVPNTSSNENNSDETNRRNSNIVTPSLKKYKCDQEPLENVTLRRHIRAVHVGEKSYDAKKYKCSMCDQELTEKATLRRHIRAVHAGEKPYRCEHCNYKCASSGSLYKHLKIHTGEKPHVCQICNWKFVEKCKLRRHMKVHVRERHLCGHCGHRARTIDTLNKHIQRLHNNVLLVDDAGNKIE